LAGLFFSLKAGQARPKNTKQAKNRVTVLQKILQIACLGGEGPRKGEKSRNGCI